MARIQSVLRRVTPSEVAGAAGDRSEVTAATDVVAAGPVTVDFARREVVRNGQVVHVSRREFDLLALLLSPPGQVRTREELIDRLWSGQDLADTRTLDTHVRRLRMKLERDSVAPGFLVTVRGVGFRFDPEGRTRPSGASGGPPSTSLA